MKSGGKKNTRNQEGRDEGYKQQSKKKPSSSHDSAAGRKMGTELITRIKTWYAKAGLWDYYKTVQNLWKQKL